MTFAVNFRLVHSPMSPFAHFPLPKLDWRLVVRVAPGFAWGLVMVLGAAVTVDLYRRLATPRPLPLPVAAAADPQLAGAAIAGRHLMGIASSEGQLAEAQALASAFTLQAAVSGAGGRPGWAVIASDNGKQQAYLEGEEIKPGVILAKVVGDHVELAIGGARLSVALAVPTAGDDGVGAAADSALPADSPVNSLPSPNVADPAAAAGRSQ